MKMVIGSAAWRNQYGSFSKGLLSETQIYDLTTRAASLGFDYIDTAPSYGDAEAVIGKIRPNQNVATKVTVDTSDFNSILRSIELSKSNLNLETLDLVFIHNWDILTESEKLISADLLQECALNQTIKSWGFSTYEVLELKKVKNYGWSNLKVQINSNILDQRILEIQSFLREMQLVGLNSEIWVRSIFLQGVLLDETQRNPHRYHRDILQFFSLCKSLNISPLEMCIAYVRQLEFIDGVIIGIENNSQLDEIVKSFQLEVQEVDFNKFKSTDIELIDPRKWRLSS